MDFLDPKKKRSHTIRLYVGYLLIAIAISIGTLILLFAAYGYGIDRSGKVIQNGLVFISSRPSQAEAIIENNNKGTVHHATTNTRQILPEGTYSVTLNREGYRSWYRTFHLDGSGIERMVYPLLFPEELVTEDVQLYASAPPLSTVSPDRHWIIIQHIDNFLRFDVFDAGDPERAARVITVPNNILSAATGPQHLEVVEWSTDNKHLLLKHTFNNTHEFVVINHEDPAASFNVNTTFNTQPAGVLLKDKKIDELYLHTGVGDTLQIGEVQTRRVTPLIEKVITFKPHGNDMIVYATPNPDNEQEVLARLQTNDTAYTVRTLPAGTTYLLDLARFDNSWYVVIGAQSDNRVYIYKDPLPILRRANSNQLLSARTMRIDNPTTATFSNNARFMAVQSGQYFAVYDAETDRQYKYEIKDPLHGALPAQWMDGHRLTAISDDSVLIFDFDGINVQKLSAIQPNTKAMFDRDYTGLYTVAPSSSVPGRFALTRTALIIEE